MRRCSAYEVVCAFFISIHAPRVGCDAASDAGFPRGINFNPRTPGGVRLCARQLGGRKAVRFQSTHPGWGATKYRHSLGWAYVYFNPRTPGGVRLSARFFVSSSMIEISIHAPRVGCDPALKTDNIQAPFISIHAPRVGCDGCSISYSSCPVTFQSTHPGWGATHERKDGNKVVNDFNPRTPGGVRLRFPYHHNARRLLFQSTHPGWGATTT